VLLEPLAQIPLALIQARVESATFIAVSVSQFLSRIALTVLFVAGLGWGVFGVFGATALNGTAYAFALSGRELARGVAWPGWRELGRLLAFALPFLPGALCFFVMQHGDRFFLLRCRDAEEVAVYSLGYKLAGVVAALTLLPLYRVWGARLYEAARGRRRRASSGPSSRGRWPATCSWPWAWPSSPTRRWRCWPGRPTRRRRRWSARCCWPACASRRPR
jgi:O-antigen/teichoic acid export membrane protein